MTKKKTIEQFIEEANIVHNFKYDYSKAEYINNRTNLIITCPIHGDFKQSPTNHLNGSGCPICGLKNRNTISPFKGQKLLTYNRPTKLTTEDFINKAKEVHGDKYDYSKVEYINSKIDVDIICKKHGLFHQKPYKHLQGQGCRLCAIEKDSLNKLKTTEEFIYEANKIHNNKYDYSKAIYNGNRTKLTIICPIHGEFEQCPNNHLEGKGCPYCNESHLERIVRNFLIENKIDFETQKKFEWLGLMSFDFYLPKHNMVIECQGKQHFGLGGWNSEYDFEETYDRDIRKFKKAIENNVKLLYYINEKILHKINLNDEKFQGIYNEENIITDLNKLIKILYRYERKS